MRNRNQRPRLQYNLDKLLPEDERPELDLALWLDHAQPGDSALGVALLKSYGAQLYRLALVLQKRRKGGEAVKAALELASHTLALAIADPGGLRGEESVRDWLFKLLVGLKRRNPLDWLLKPELRRLATEARRRSRVRKEPGAPAELPLPSAPKAQPETDSERRAWALLDRLPETARMAVTLRYTFELGISAIARCLRSNPKRVQQAIAGYRSAVLAGLREAGYEWSAPDPAHKPELRQLEAALDKRQPAAAPGDTHLASHLESCQAYSADLQRLDGSLRAWLQKRHPKPALDSALESHLVGGMQASLQKPAVQDSRLGLARQALVLLLLGALILGSDWLLRQTRSNTGLLAPAGTPAPVPRSQRYQTGYRPERLPRLIDRPPYRQVEASAMEPDPSRDALERIYFSEPAISADGRWTVYTSRKIQQAGTGAETSAYQILLYDRELKETSSIFPARRRSPRAMNWPEDLNQPFFEQSEGWWASSADISADGRWIVFNLIQNAQVNWDTQRCRDARVGCGFVMLYDRQTGRYRPVSTGQDGLPASGPGANPSISADGRWVVYWSSASNLVSGDDEICLTGGEPYSCWDLFLYDRETRALERLPVGRHEGELSWNAPLSLSADGSRLAMTVHQRDLLGSKLGLAHPTEVYVLDRQSGEYLPANQTASGTPGDGPASQAALSEDGRWVAFATTSRNLKAGDDNGYYDVYIKDLAGGGLEWASQTASGAAANSHSGMVLSAGSSLSSGAAGVDRISFSSDGRSVIFLSAANNLVTGSPVGCVIFDLGGCVNIYLHDRVTGQSEQIAPAYQKDGPVQSPLISADGEWIVSTSRFVHCSYQDICSEIRLYNREAQTEQRISPGDLALLEGDDPWTIQRLEQHNGAVNALAFSPDGQTIATGSYDNQVRLFRVADGELVGTLSGHSRPISALAFSPGGEVLASASLDAQVILWSVADGALLQSLDHQGHELYSLAFSPGGERLAVGAAHQSWIWQLEWLQDESAGDKSAANQAARDFELSRTFSAVLFEYPHSFVNSVAFSPDGNLLALGLSDNSVWVRRVSDGEVLLRLGSHDDRVMSVAFSPDSSYLASGSADGSANLWQLYYAEKHVLHASFQLSMRHSGWVKSLAFTPDGDTLVTGSFDGGLRMWSIPDGELLSSYLRNYGEQLLNIAVSPDGRTLAAGSVRSLVRLVRFPAP